MWNWSDQTEKCLLCLCLSSFAIRVSRTFHSTLPHRYQTKPAVAETQNHGAICTELKLFRTSQFYNVVAFPLNTQSFALQRKVNKRFRTSCWPFSPAQCLAPRNVCTAAVVTSVVIMFRTKKDVDKHVQDINSKIKNVSERNLKGYSIAKLYFGVSFHVEHFIPQNSYVT